MDQATALKILQNSGAPPTPDNLNRVMQQSGRGSEILGRSLGLQGGADESGPSSDLMLDKLAQATAPRGAAPIMPDSMSDGSPANGSVRGGSNVVPIRNPKMPSRQQGYGDVASPKPNEYTAPEQTFYGSEGDVSGLTSGPTGGSGEAPGSLGWLMALLGISAAGNRGVPPIGDAPKQIGYEPKLPAPNKQLAAPNKQLTDQSGTKFESGAPKIAADDIAPDTTVNEPKKAAPKSAPVRPQFTDQEMLVDAVRNFQKMFRK